MGSSPRQLTLQTPNVNSSSSIILVVVLQIPLTMPVSLFPPQVLPTRPLPSQTGLKGSVHV